MKKFPEFYGVVTVGAKGQVVIPSKVRKLLNVKSGDSLIVMSNRSSHKKMINLIPSDEFSRFLNRFEEHIADMKAKILNKGD